MGVSVLGSMYRQFIFKPKPLPESVSLDGKTALVTGANGGLGLETCKELCEHGLARLIITVRDVTKGETAKKQIVAQNADVQVEVWNVDQESFESIKEFADRVAQLDRLDIAILNAGVKMTTLSKSSTGHERNLQVRFSSKTRWQKLGSAPCTQVNHLGTALLSLLLIEPLQRTGTETSPARLTIVSSETHFYSKFEEINAPNTLAHMDDEKSFGSGMDRYNTTKLLNVLWTRELSKRVGGNIIVDTVNPGSCQSNLHRHNSSHALFVNLIGWTSTQGGHCLTDAAIQHGRDGHGAYMSEQTIKRCDSAPN